MSNYPSTGTPLELLEIEREVRALLDALERMHGNTFLSPNVRDAQSVLRERFPKILNPSDRTTERL